MLWAYTKDGVYSVRTAYMLGMNVTLQPQNRIWDIIWRSDIPPKIRHFLWKLVSGILPTRELLHKRHIAAAPKCPLCFNGPETVSHVFFSCGLLQDFWEDIGSV